MHQRPLRFQGLGPRINKVLSQLAKRSRMSYNCTCLLCLTPSYMNGSHMMPSSAILKGSTIFAMFAALVVFMSGPIASKPTDLVSRNQATAQTSQPAEFPGRFQILNQDGLQRFGPPFRPPRNRLPDRPETRPVVSPVTSQPDEGTGYRVIYTFGQYSGDGSRPNGSLTFFNGALYGTTYEGGNSNCYVAHQWGGCGTVFAVNNSGTHVIYSFKNLSDGILPNGDLTVMNGGRFNLRGNGAA